jgi:hypothetical protein
MAMRGRSRGAISSSASRRRHALFSRLVLVLTTATFMLGCADTVAAPNPEVKVQSRQMATVTSLSGKARSTTRDLRTGAILATDSVTFVSVLDHDGTAVARVNTSVGKVLLVVGESFNEAQRQGTWQKSKAESAPGLPMSVEYTASEGRPVGRTEIRRSGQLLFAVDTDWDGRVACERHLHHVLNRPGGS